MEHQVSDFLVNSWAVMLTLMLTMYVLLDGFDLGIGILSLIERDSSRQNLMIGGLNGVWDANETWLVLAGGTLFGAFPLAYAAALQTLYLPVMTMLFGLIFRGVAFEFRLYAKQPQVWTWAFGVGSLVAALSQGMIFGALIGGLRLPEADAEVQILSWPTPMALWMALSLVAVYTLLGASWWLAKAGNDFSSKAYRWVWASATVLTLMIPVTLFALAKTITQVAERWLASPFSFSVLALGMAASLLVVMVGLGWRQTRMPFIGAVSFLIIAVAGLFASFFPDLLPGVMTLHHAASSTRTLEFMLWAVGGLLPLILGYNAYQYYVFRGPISVDH